MIKVKPPLSLGRVGAEQGQRAGTAALFSAVVLFARSLDAKRGVSGSVITSPKCMSAVKNSTPAGCGLNSGRVTLFDWPYADTMIQVPTTWFGPGQRRVSPQGRRRRSGRAAEPGGMGTARLGLQ